MNRQKIRQAFDNIRPDEETKLRMLENILRQSSEIPPAGKDDTMKHKKMRPVLIAAIIALSILLMGSAVFVRYTIATAPDFPSIDPASVPVEDIHLSVDNVKSTSMRVYCVIDGVEYGVNDIVILCNGPYTLEKKMDERWELLPVKVDDPQWDADEVVTTGSSDWTVDWAVRYGALPAGTYRYTATVLEGNVPVSVEFAVDTDDGQNDLAEQVNAVLKNEYYHIRYTSEKKFGNMDNLRRSDKELIQSEYENVVWTEEYWKLGEDLLYLSSRNDQIWTGMMYKNGIKYQLDHEGNDRRNPISGWSPWPGGDMFWLTNWTNLMEFDPTTLDIQLKDNGTLKRAVSVVVSEKFWDSYDVETTAIDTWEFLSTDRNEIEQKFSKQNVDTALEFSWIEDCEKMEAADVEFVNTDISPIETASKAIARAMAECTVEHDKILVYRDETENMWKVEFQILYGYNGYQYIYMNDDGITQMVSNQGSKVTEWRDK